MGTKSFVSDVFKVLGFLGFLVAVSVFIIKRRWKDNPIKAGSLSVLDSQSLGGNRTLCVVRWKQNLLLLGVTDHSVTLLKSQEQPEEDPGPNFETTLEDKTVFQQVLSKFKGKDKDTGKFLVVGLILTALFFALPTCAASAAPTDIPVPNINITLPEETQGGLAQALSLLGVLTVLALAPAILILTTSFTRIVMVFSFLRSGLGTQQTPPNQVLVGLALLITFFVMAPTWSTVNEAALAPYLDGYITAKEAFDRASEPLKEFMLRETREKDLALFLDASESETPESPQEMSIMQIAPAFAISELKTAFEMGFLIYLPFLVIDMVVASTLMAMGMLMLPPVLISLPFKILLFILVDGWGLISKTLIAGFR